MSDKPAVKKFPEGWIEGVNPILDKFLDEVASRRKIAYKTRAILHIRTFLRYEKGVNIDPYQIDENLLLIYGRELEEYLVERWKDFNW